jgi:large subunit ribosomal protein L24
MIKVGDLVLIIAGNFKGKKGKVLKSFPSESSVCVDGIGVFERKKKDGAIQSVYRKIHISNVKLTQ